MDITLSKVEGVALVQRKHIANALPGLSNYNTIVIYTDKGTVRLELFGDKPLVIQLGDNE
jgi:hypothetical protein